MVGDVEDTGELEGQTSIDDVLIELGELPTAAAYDVPTLF